MALVCCVRVAPGVATGRPSGLWAPCRLMHLTCQPHRLALCPALPLPPSCGPTLSTPLASSPPPHGPHHPPLPAGITLSPSQVQRGTELAAERGLSNAKFQVCVWCVCVWRLGGGWRSAPLIAAALPSAAWPTLASPLAPAQPPHATLPLLHPTTRKQQHAAPPPPCTPPPCAHAALLAAPAPRSTPAISS